MTLKGLTESLNTEMGKMKRTMTRQKLAEWMCVAAISGAVTGILYAYKSGKRIREAQKNETEHSAVIIKVRDLDAIRIERIE